MASLRPSLTILLLTVCATQLPAVTLLQFNTPTVENFDTLDVATSSTLPAGWELVESGSSANTTYGAGTGSSSTGNTYSFGATGSTERSLGSLRTSGVASTFGTIVTNDTGSTLTDLTIEFTGEQWRLGALGRVDRLDFGYSIDATSIGTGVWLEVDALDFTAPVTGGVTGALDGNAAGNQLLLAYTLSGLNLPSGTSMWLRWVDFDATGSDDGLAIDNFSISAPQATTGGGGGSTLAVPDHLPTSVIIVVMGGLLALARRHDWALSGSSSSMHESGEPS
ncbi:MAG: PEPxxWA-CTERM sorting domain-containing protein [Opitutaceae bacterium]